nr:retrotransposon protein, putative, Ty1-copia subclass [Tanacetum cinerariifolium]
MTPHQLLKSTDDESFDQYVSCLSGKMKKKSFPHRLERAIDLFGLIHTDVCGPLRHVPRQEVSGRAGELEEIQDEDTSPSEITSKIPVEVEGLNHLMGKKLLFVGVENRHPMLKNSQYNSWQSRIKLYIRGKEYGKDLLDLILNGPFKYGTFVVPGTLTLPEITRQRTYDDLTDKENIREECDITRHSGLEKLKQSTTAMSATEAEYIAASEATMEAV